MIGIASMESIPVYHYSPGGIAVRVVLSSIEYPVYKCDSFPICLFGEGGRILSFQEVDERFIGARARAWSARSIFLDGLEPLVSMSERSLLILKDMAEAHRYSLGARSLGLANKEILDILDYLVIDYVRDYAIDYSLPGEAIKFLYEALKSDVWIEASAYVREPDPRRLHPLVTALEGSETPLHVFIEQHKGGGPVKELYEELNRKLDYVYIHNDLYPRLDTMCPRCGSPIAARDEGILRSLELNDSRCWKCGYRIPVRGDVRKKTPSHLLITLDEGGVKWYHPSQLIGDRLGYWLGRM